MLGFVSATFVSCSSSKSVSGFAKYTVDSVKIEISKPVAPKNSITLSVAENACVIKNETASTPLSTCKTAQLKKLADERFISKKTPVILSEEAYNGRTCHILFDVTIYKNGVSTTQRFDMGDDSKGFTLATKKEDSL